MRNLLCTCTTFLWALWSLCTTNNMNRGFQNGWRERKEGEVPKNRISTCNVPVPTFHDESNHWVLTNTNGKSCIIIKSLKMLNVNQYTIVHTYIIYRSNSVHKCFYLQTVQSTKRSIKQNFVSWTPHQVMNTNSLIISRTVEWIEYEPMCHCILNFHLVKFCRFLNNENKFLFCFVWLLSLPVFEYGD